MRMTTQQQKIVVENMDWASSLALSFRRQAFKSTVDDLRQAAYLGLCEAVVKFNPEHRNSTDEYDEEFTPFQGFAYPFVKGELKKQNKIDISPLSISRDEIEEAYKTNFSNLSVYQAVKCQSDYFSQHVDRIPDSDNREEYEDAKELISLGMDALNEREKELIRLRFFQGLSYKELEEQHRIDGKKRSEKAWKDKMSRIYKKMQHTIKIKMERRR